MQSSPFTHHLVGHDPFRKTGLHFSGIMLAGTFESGFDRNLLTIWLIGGLPHGI
jgi:hypothetical protein